MVEEKIEIKLQSKTSFYIDLIKKNIIKVIKIIAGFLILAGTLYIGFYILLFFIFLGLISYLLKNASHAEYIIQLIFNLVHWAL